MAGYVPMKTKRKDLDGVNDDFSDMSLLSPARKIRRLDADSRPILEEEAFPLAFEQQSAVTEESPSVVPSLNEERALVIFSPLFNSPPPSIFSVTVDSDVISGFKNFWASQSNHVNPAQDDVEAIGNKNSLAIVPWVPSPDSQVPFLHGSQAEATELMEADEAEIADMEIESSNVSGPSARLNEPGDARGADGLSQWLQQHCMTPQLSLVNSTSMVPVTGAVNAFAL